jgi:hypothetical protein
MSRKQRERGEGQLGCLVGLVLLVIAAVIAYRLIPVKVRTADLRETVVDEAKSAGQHNDNQILGAILNKAKLDELPVLEENVKIVRTSNYIRVDVDYTVPVQFPGYVYNWHFHHHAENPVF